MASAAIASQNEPNWGHMGKIPYSRRQLNANPNPNPNPKKKPKQYHNAGGNGNGKGNGVASRYHNNGHSPVVTQTASDDAYSFNQTSSTSRIGVNCGRYLTFSPSSYAKSELLELRKSLSSELEQIRDLQNRIESGQFSGNPRSHAKFKKCSVNERPIAAFGPIPDRAFNRFYNGNLNPVDCELLLKECKQIVAKLLKQRGGNIFKKPVDAVALGLHDYHQIVKHPMDLGTVKEKLAKNLYPTPVEFAADVRLTFNNAILYNPKHDMVHGIAQQLLSRFEDLFRPIQGKIDSCADQQREEEFQECRMNQDVQYQRNQLTQGNSWSNHNQSQASPLRANNVKQITSPAQVPQVTRKVERVQMPMQTHSSASTSSNPPPPVSNYEPRQVQISSPARVPIEPVKDQKPVKGGMPVKQPKPKAKDPNKREMSMDEKQRLGNGLQNLPQEKMPQLVQIIRKRNDHLAQDDDEIELDIEALDKETLWELDRFVTNWKKFQSKSKRQSQMTNNDSAAGITAPSSPMAEADMGLLRDKNDDYVKKLKENDDEDVDIDDDMPATSFPPVEIEKDVVAVVGDGDGQNHDHDHNDRGNASSSSSGSGSSSSDTSSSSGSDSGSSSESDSDADDAQS